MDPLASHHHRADQKDHSMTHDPLCPVIAGCFCEVPDELCCQCDLIAKVRKDEQARQRAEMTELCIEARKQ